MQMSGRVCMEISNTQARHAFVVGFDQEARRRLRLRFGIYDLNRKFSVYLLLTIKTHNSSTYHMLHQPRRNVNVSSSSKQFVSSSAEL